VDALRWSLTVAAMVQGLVLGVRVWRRGKAGCSAVALGVEGQSAWRSMLEVVLGERLQGCP